MTSTIDSTDTSIYNEALPGNSNVLYSGAYASTASVGIGTPIFSSTSNLKFSFFTPDLKLPSGTVGNAVRSQISCISSIAQPLIRTSGTKWGSSNAILNSIKTKTKSFVIIDSNGEKFITTCPNTNASGNISATTTPGDFFVYPYFCSKPINSDFSAADVDIGRTTIGLTFNKFMAMQSPAYSTNANSTFLTTGKTTIQTSSFINKNNKSITVEPKVFLGTTTNNYNTASVTEPSACTNNPYGIRFTVRDSITSTVLNTTVASNITNNVYCRVSSIGSIVTNSLNVINGNSVITPGAITLAAGQVLDISLLKMIAAPSSTFVGESSIVFIDMDNLIYTTPTLTLSAANSVTGTDNKPHYTYNHEDLVSFNCNVSANNINGDNINGQTLKLYIKNSSSGEQVLSVPITSTVVNGSANFSFLPGDKKKLLPGNYTAYVSYDSTQTALTANSASYPDDKSHYNSGNSNEFDFVIDKQEIRIEYVGTLRTPVTPNDLPEYSILEQWDFRDFKIYDNYYGDSTDEVIAYFNSTTNQIVTTDANKEIRDASNNIVRRATLFNCQYDFKIDKIIPGGNDVPAHYLLGQQFNAAKFYPGEQFTINHSYKFYVQITSLNNSNGTATCASATSPKMSFKTEGAIFTSKFVDMNNNVIVNPVSYKSQIKLCLSLRDKSNRVYTWDNMHGIGRANLYHNPVDSTLDVALNIDFNNASGNYEITFSPKSLNLLRVNKTEYSVVPTIEIYKNNNGGYEAMYLTSENTNVFVFNGVEYLTDLTTVSPTVYTSVNALAYIKDKTSNEVLSSVDIPYTVTYSLTNATNGFDNQLLESQNVDNKYAYSFTPSSLNINTSHNPLTLKSVFSFSDSLINTVTQNNAINVASINPTIAVTPTSEVNDYHYGQDFTVTLTGLTGKNDVGSLYLYGTSSTVPVATITNALLNNVYHFTNIDIDELVGDAALSTLNLNQVINGSIKWVPNEANSTIYGEVQMPFDITLSKTETEINSVVITNNNCNFTDTITVSGTVVTTYNENIDGVVELYKVVDGTPDLSVVIAQSTVSVNSSQMNVFTMNVTSSVVESYNFVLKFVPTYLNVYSSSESMSVSNFIQFRKITISPVVSIYDLNTNLMSDLNVTNMTYTHNFNIVVNGLEPLNNTEVVIKISDKYASEPLLITSGSVTAEGINFINVSLTNFGNITSPKSILLEFVGYNEDATLKSLYAIEMPTNKIQFQKDMSKPTFNTISIKTIGSGATVSSLYFEQEFNIFGSFSLLKDSNNDIIPLNGVLNLYIDSKLNDPIVLATDLTLTSEDQQLFEGFIPSYYNIYAGQRKFFFEFVPSDTNITTISTSELSYNVTASTIDSVSITFSPLDGAGQTYYGEQFAGSFTYYNIGATGSIKVYCKPNGALDDSENVLLATVVLTPTLETKNSDVTYDFTCNAIPFDCLYDSMSYDIIVKYVSDNLSKYTNNDVATSSYSVSKMPIKLSNLLIDGSDYDRYTYSNITKKIGSTLVISGKITTLDNTVVSSGKMELIGQFVTNDDGQFLNTAANTLPLVGGIKDTVTHTDYVTVDSQGNFTLSLLLTSDSALYTNYMSTIQLLFRSTKNFADQYIAFDYDIPGIYTVEVSNQDMSPSDFTFSLIKSTLTNSYNYPFHEDAIHFSLEILNDYSSLANATVTVVIVRNDTGAAVGNGTIKLGTYSMTLSAKTKTVNGVQKTIGYGELLLNPKSEDIPYLNSSANYSAVCYFSAPGYNNYSEGLRDSTNEAITFNVQQTTPTFEIVVSDPDSGLSVSDVNYEGNVNISIKVRTTYEIQSGVNQSRNILGTVYLRNQTIRYNDNGTLMSLKKSDGSFVDSYEFDSVEDANGSWTQGVVLNYAPKDNCDKFISDVKMIFALFMPSSTNYTSVTDKYNPGAASPALTISKYTPELSLNTISVVNDVLHAAAVNKIDNKNIYYDVAGNAIYNGVINYDEQFQVTTTLNKNIGGKISYYYSSSNAVGTDWTQINPVTSTLTGVEGQSLESQDFTAIFNKKLLHIPTNHIYYMKAIFTPTVNDTANAISTFYNTDESVILYFNVYQANEFGSGKLFWNSVTNTTISNTCSYTSAQNIDVAVEFTFNSTSANADRRVSVSLYHTDFETNSNKFYGPFYLDGSDGVSSVVSTVITVPATTFNFKSDAYSIRALFTPVLTDGTDTRNQNYPVTPELSPISLTVKPFITASKTNFTYQYSDPIALNVTFNSGVGISNITPYSKLYVDISNTTSNTYSYATQSIISFTGVSVNFPTFNEIINGQNDNLRPGNYTLSMYATNDVNSSVVRTETFVTNFSISKKQVTMSLTFDKYNLSYRQSNVMHVNIGNFPINVGNVHVAFQHARNVWAVANCYIDSSSLVEVSPNSYKYEIADMSAFMVAGTGPFKISADLDNMYYNGGQSDIPGSRMLVTQEQNTAIVLEQSIFDVAYGSDITINAATKYGETETINIGQLKLSINNSEFVNVGRSFIVKATDLVKDINNLVLSYVDSNDYYVIHSVPFQINVIKKTIAQPTLYYSASENTDSTFKLHLSGISDSDSVSFYKLSSVTRLVPTAVAAGVYTFNLVDLAYGDNTIYAVVRSSTYDIDSTQVSVVRNKYDVSVALLDTVFNSTYKANSTVNIKYKVTKNLDENQVISNNGIIEFHKIMYADDGVNMHHDEIIGYATVINNVASISNFKLVGNSIVSAAGQYYDSKIKFYAKFNGSNDYNDAETVKSSLISITTKDTTRLLDDNALSATYKLGDTITLGYIALKPSSTSDDEDADVQAAVDAEQAAMKARTTASAEYSAAKAIYDVADKAYWDSYTAVGNANTALANALSEKNSAYTDMITAQNAVATAQTILYSAAADKDAAELSYRTVQEVSKLAVLEMTLSDAQSRISAAESEYNTSLANYNTKLDAYNTIMNNIATKQSEVDTASTALRSAETVRDNALLDVVDKENAYNVAQLAYQTELSSSNTSFGDISAKQSELITLTNQIELVKVDYETTHNDYTTKKADYDTKKAAFDIAEPQLASDKSAALAAYNLANSDYEVCVTANEEKAQDVLDAETAVTVAASNLLAQTSTQFTLGDLSGMWAVIDQQSTNATAQNPFFVVYTLKDSVTANASWYKSKLFYGSNVGATVAGPMLLYTGSDPVAVHPEITNRVELVLDASLSAGLQDSSEIVKALSIQTSSNMNGTQVDDYQFVFKEFGTSGLNANATVSFIPTADNNNTSVYADGVQGTNVLDNNDTVVGWSFNNHELTGTGKMPKINWYVKYNATEETSNAKTAAEAQLVTAQADKLVSQTALDAAALSRDTALDVKETAYSAYDVAHTQVVTAKNLMDSSFALYEPVNTEYNELIADKTAVESQLAGLQTPSSSALSGLFTAMNVAKDNLDASKLDKVAKQGLLDTAQNNFTTKSIALQTAKDALTAVTAGITIVQDVNNLLVIKNNKYVIWKAYVRYVAILQENPSNVDNTIYNAINQESSAYNANYTNWKSAVTSMKTKQVTYSNKVTAWTNAGTALTTAETLKANLYTEWRNKQNVEIEKGNAKTTAQTAYDAAKTASDLILAPIAISNGYVEIYKLIVNNGVTMSQIIGKVKPDSRGLVSLDYRLVDLGQVTFYGKLTDLPNYYDSQSTNVSVNVFERYDTSIINKTVFNAELYKVGDNIQLSYAVVKNNLQQTPIIDGQLAIYKKVGDNVQLLKYYQVTPASNGLIQHNYTLVDSGSVKFYAKYIYSTNNEDEIGSEQTISVLSKLNTTITDISVSASPYKLGNIISLKYQFTSVNVRNISGVSTTRTDNIESGLVEFHKCIDTLDEIIGYVSLAPVSNGIAELQHQLVDIGTASFYVKYMGTQNNEPKSNSDVKRIISIADKFIVTVTNTSNLASGVSKKLGTTVIFSYGVQYGSVLVNEGLMEITKTVMVSGKTFTEVLGYAPVSNGVSSFNHKFTDIDTEVTITARYVNSSNYKESDSAEVVQNTINVYSKYNSKIVKTQALQTSYKLGDMIVLEYKVTDSSDQAIIADGIISIHKKTINASGSIIDEILYYDVPQAGTGKVMYTYKLDTLDTVKFYAIFNDSADYYDSVTSEETFSSIKEISTATNKLTLSSETPVYASNIVLTSTISDNAKQINEGVVAFYATVAGKPSELIGISNVVTNVATLDYVVNDMGAIVFSSVFKNTSNYVDVSSSNITANVSKANIQSIALSSLSGMEFDIVNVVATVTYGKELCYKDLGKVEFTIVNNSVTSVANVDIINSIATYKLYISNKLPFTVNAKFLGNETFNASSVDTKTFTPAVNNNYKELLYTETSFPAMDNHYVINATIGLNDATVDEKFMLLNTGFVVFEAIRIADSIVDVSNTVSVPLVNGAAKCIVRKDVVYTYNIKYVDVLSSPNVSVTGVKVVASEP